MDESQHRAADEFTKSPLRIREIADSGKTIVLAGRVAYLLRNVPIGTNFLLTGVETSIIPEKDNELLIALIDAGDVDAIKAFIRNSSLSRRRKRCG